MLTLAAIIYVFMCFISNWNLLWPLRMLIEGAIGDKLIALGWGLSWLLNRVMPDTLTCERVSQIAPEKENVYTGNVEAFIKRLRTETRIETFTSIYFLVTTAVIVYLVFKAGVNDWIALIVFGFFTFGVISRSISLSKALAMVKSNPTPEQSAKTAEEVYKLDYAAYYEGRQSYSYEQMFPECLQHFKAFQIFSIVIGGICSLLGLLYVILASIVMIGSDSLAADALAGMYLLYGCLATYFGIKDFSSIIQSLRIKQLPISNP